MATTTYIVSDCNGATFKRLSTFLTRGKAKAMRVVYDAEHGTLDLLTSTDGACFTPKDCGVTHARIPVGAAHTDAAGVSAIADFAARDAAKAFKMADAKATYAAVLTVDDDTRAATFALRVGDVTDVAVAGTCPKADDMPNKSYAVDALEWAARLNTPCDGKAFAHVGTYTFDGKAFAAALKQVALSAAVADNERPLLCGVHMAFDDGGVRVEATDRFRVSRLTIAAADATPDSHEYRDVVVSAPELCGIVQAFADGKSATVTVDVYRCAQQEDQYGKLRVRGAAFAGIDVILQTTDGAYPRVQHLYGRADVTCVESIKAADVVAAVKRVCPNWNRKRHVTPVHVSGNGNVVIVWDPETLMSVRFNVPCGEFNFSFNPRFLIDALTQTADADGCVSISGTKREAKDVVPAHFKPVQFCGADGAAGIETVVVPMSNQQGGCVPCPFFAPATPAADNDAADVVEPSAPKTDAAADVAETATADAADAAMESGKHEPVDVSARMSEISDANRAHLGGIGVLYTVPSAHDAIVYVTPDNKWWGYSHYDDSEHWSHDPSAAGDLPWDMTLAELEAAGMIVPCPETGLMVPRYAGMDIPPSVTACYCKDDAYEWRQRVHAMTEEAGWEHDGGMIMRVVPADTNTDADATAEVDQAETVIVEPVEVEHDGVVDVEMVETAEIPAVTAETLTADAAIPAPRTVQSSPALPAECSAETVEIPEVPPQTNKDAHVLAVSEHVIPTGESVPDAFGVVYRAVHYVRRVVKRRDGTTTKKKVAAVFRHGDEIQVLRRDRYENAGRDAAVEAEIAAHVARLQRAA